MKLNLLFIIVAIFIASYTNYAQSQNGTTPFFFNKGLITVQAENINTTRLYIGGDMYTGSDDLKPDEITSKIRIENSTIHLNGNFINEVKTLNVFNNEDITNPGIFKFESEVLQEISFGGVSYETRPSKKTSYIDFPNLTINNAQKVFARPEVAIQTLDINLPSGWLVLESRNVNSTDYPGGIITADQQKNRSISTHLLVNGSVNYLNLLDTNPLKRGFIQVDLVLDPNNEQFEYRSLHAFGSPFRSMKADYFMFNFLVAPTNNGFLGDTGATIVAPTYTLEAGRGYVLGIDLRGSDPGSYNLNELYPGISFADRAKDGYIFNRSFHAANNNPNQIFGTDPSSPEYQMEQLNNENIEIPLRQGYNYLANPYVSPLDISDLLGENTANDWNIVSDIASNTNRGLVNRVWIMNGDASARSLTETSNWISFNYKYYVAMNEGGTYTGDNFDTDGELIIPPLQMFVVYAPKAGTITIPKSARTMGDTHFIRSAKEPRRDDFIIEVIDELTGTSDRVSTVIRDGSLIGPDKKYQNIKRVKVNSGGGNTRSVNADEYVEPTLSSQIYTRDTDGSPLTVEFLPLQTTTSTKLYLTPSTITQNIAIRGIRLNSMDEVREVWLEDKQNGGSLTLMTPELLYKTETNPNDPTDRFILHFKTTNSTGIEDDKTVSNISVHYSNQTLTASGFETSDYGSSILLFDIHGRLLKSVIIDDNSIRISIPLPSGAYMVRIDRTQPYITKFIAK